MTSQRQQIHNGADKKPRYAVPAGTTDCHCHVFENPSRFPLAENRSYTPPICAIEDYLAMANLIGIDRIIQVNASVYGFDNSVTLNVISGLGQHRARGVAGISPDATFSEIRLLHEGGMRGARLSTSVRGYGGMDAIEIIANKIKPFGWHLQLHLKNGMEITALEHSLAKLPVPIVFDHLGRNRGSDGISAPGFQALLRLLNLRNDVWVKISSWYRLSDSGHPNYDDMGVLARALIAARPDRCVWGSNWPHPDYEGMVPSDSELISNFFDWVPNKADLHRILVDNPGMLYGFD